MLVSLLDFIEKGTFGPIAIGTNIYELEEHFGKPNTIKEFENNCGKYIYGALEFFYNLTTKNIYAILCQDIANLFSTHPNSTHLKVNNILTLNLDILIRAESNAYGKIKKTFDELHLEYEEKEEKFWNKIVFNSGVEFLFNNYYEYPEDQEYDKNSLVLYGFRNFPVFHLTPKVLNTTLRLSMEWGKNWLQDIKPRLQKLYFDLPDIALEKCADITKQVNSLAHQLVSSNPKGNNKFINKEEFNNIILKKYIWINKDNLNTLYSQSCYYALK